MNRAVAARAAAWLLRYPDDEVLAALPTVAAAVDELGGGPVADNLRAVCGYLADGDPVRLQADYVQGFDLRKRCCLHLTYYTAGDTRRRGVALVEFAAAYRRAGLAVTGAELPDFLPAVLELASAHEAGWPLLHSHRVGLDLLAEALAADRSIYRRAVVAVRDLLPPAGPAQRAAARRLAEQGPPAELVGLEAFTPPTPISQPRR